LPKVLIIADDLTGANDSAVQFAERGMTAATLLCTRDGAVAGQLPEAQVLAVSTESRNESAAKAVETTGRLAGHLIKTVSPEVVLKKIDSTLRGNAGAETKVVSDLLRLPVVVAPAYPQTGRTVKGGTLYVGGVPLSETYAARDVLAPVRSSFVSDYFDSIVASSASPLTIADAETQADLLSLVESYMARQERVLWVGSAGLAQALAAFMARGHGGANRDSVSWKRGRTLVLFGSLNPVAVSQVEAIRGERETEVILPSSAHDLAGAAVAAMESKSRRVVVATHKIESPAHARSETAEAMRSFFGDLARTACRSGVFANMVISGGDVAFAALRSLNTTAIDIRREVLPGIAFGVVIGGDAEGMGIVTKAGGFGAERSLNDILSWLEQEEHISHC